MRRIFSLPIRRLLCLMALIVALPAAGIIIYSGIEERNDAIKNARMDSSNLADDLAREQQVLVASTKQLLSALAQLPEIKNQNREKAQPILAEILKINPQFLNIVAADRDGKIWVSAIPSTTSISIADRRHFVNARKTGHFSSGEYVVGRLLGKPMISFGYPYRVHGNFSGVIVSNINLEHYRTMPQHFNLPAGSSYALSDYKGTIIDTGMRADEFRGIQYDPREFLRMQRGPDRGSFKGRGLDSTERFITYRKLQLEGESAPYIYIRAGIPLGVVVAKANRALMVNLGILTSLLLMGYLLVWLIAKGSLVDRISLLQQVSRRLAGGDLEARVSHLVQGGELGELGRTLDEMALRLSKEMAECRQAEEAQRGSERFLRAVIDAEPECVKLIATDGSLLMMNRAGLGMIGAESIDEVWGHSLYPLVVPQYRDAFQSLTENVFRGEEGSLEFELVGLKGNRLWLDTHAVPFRDEKGEIVSCIAVTRDITAARTSEEALRNIEEIFRLFLEHSPAHIVFKDVDHRILRMSRNFESLLGRPLEELTGRTVYDLVPGNVADAIRRDDIGVLATGQPLRREVQFQGRFYSCTRFAIPQQGKPPLVAAIMTEITERKQAEEALCRLNEALDRRVAERTAELETAIREQKSFSYSVSHDLRAPLRHINCFSAILMEDYREALPGEAREYLTAIGKATSRMGKLIDNLLKLSQVSRTVVTRSAVDLSTVAVKVSHMLREIEPQRRVDFMIAPSLCAPCDLLLVQQLLENLIGNAWKYSAKVAGACIEFGAISSDRGDVFFVRDNGAGFDMAYQDKLFLPFQRLHGAEFEGNGIGLATAHRIVQRHGGSIWAESKEGEGACFYFTLAG